MSHELPRQDEGLQERILESVACCPQTSRELADHLALPHEIVQWQVVCLFQARRIEADRSKPPRYALAGGEA